VNALLPDVRYLLPKLTQADAVADDLWVTIEHAKHITFGWVAVHPKQ
jgi:hypothetical protein